MHKIDFTAEAEPDSPFIGVKVGQQLQLAQQEDGSWLCVREDGSTVCPVPAAAAAAAIAGQPGVATAVVRTVKRCQDNPEAAVSIQVRISFATPGRQEGCISGCE
jgi:hypothetical protein